MKLRISSIIVLVWLVALGQASAQPANEQKVLATDNAFGFNLLKQIAKDQPAQNIFISPYSAATVLQMVGNGAAGQTKTEMQQVLGTTGLSDDTVGMADKKIATSLKNFNTNVILTTANAIWYREGAPVNPKFITDNQEFFGATVAAMNFLDPHSVDIVNTWASDQTHGRITHFADGMLSSDTRLFLASAVYFKGKWADPFKEEATTKRPFYLQSGGQKTISMMSQTKKFTYRNGTGYQAVRLMYEGKNIAMYVFLPDTNSSPEKLLNLMDGETWRRVTRPGFNEQEGTLAFPRFKLEYNLELKEPLEALGMKSAFDPHRADFSGIAPKLFISAARQKTFVQVTEEGTEAAAVTGITIAVNSIMMPPPNPFHMIVNRPFLFLIEDSLTGTILFIGTVFDPQPN